MAKGYLQFIRDFDGEELRGGRRTGSGGGGGGAAAFRLPCSALLTGVVDGYRSKSPGFSFHPTHLPFHLPALLLEPFFQSPLFFPLHVSLPTTLPLLLSALFLRRRATLQEGITGSRRGFPPWWLTPP